jgi:hypothetical protein
MQFVDTGTLASGGLLGCPAEQDAGGFESSATSKLTLNIP